MKESPFMTGFAESKKSDSKFSEYSVPELNWMLGNSNRLDPKQETAYAKGVIAELEYRGDRAKAVVEGIVSKPLISPMPIDPVTFDSLKKETVHIKAHTTPKVAEVPAEVVVYPVFIEKGKSIVFLMVCESSEKAIEVCSSTKHFFLKETVGIVNSLNQDRQYPFVA